VRPDPDRYVGLTREQALTQLARDIADARAKMQTDIDTFFQAAAVLRALGHEALAVKLEALAARNMASMSIDIPQFESGLRVLIDLMCGGDQG
jgi:hypothetical protein